jgi:hypothetical protein
MVSKWVSFVEEISWYKAEKYGGRSWRALATQQRLQSWSAGRLQRRKKHTKLLWPQISAELESDIGLSTLSTCESPLGQPDQLNGL